MRTRLAVLGFFTMASAASLAGVAFAQATGEAPQGAAPRPVAASAQAQPPKAEAVVVPAAPMVAPAAPAPAPAPAVTSVPAPASGAAPVVPPPPPPAFSGAPPGPATEPPPAPVYQPLGRPQPEIEKGDWDPWAHVAPSRHAHDGFFLRLGIGFGVGGLSASDHVRSDIRDVSLSSGGFATSLAIGGALVGNLILNADLYHTTLFNPAVRVDGARAGNANHLDPGLGDIGIGEDTELVGLGAGVTYYFMPINIYLAGSLGVAQVVFVNHRGDRQGSNVGLGMNFLVGKEWWVATDWGIGVAAQLIVLRAKDDVLGDIGAMAANLLFSTTYN